jgi:hypothetical protein
MKRRKQAESIWSPRSQKSMLRQLELEAAQEKCRNRIAFGQKRIAQEEEAAKRQTATVADGNNFNIRQALNKTLADIEEREREVAAFRKREKSLQAEIEGLAPSPAQAAQRAKLQSTVAAEVIERFAKDSTIDALLQKLRNALQDRASLTTKIVQTALMLDFSPTADFDAARFAALLDLLPAELATQSHDWVNWFLGQGSKKEPRTIGSKGAVLTETLACAGVWRAGEYAFLTKEEITKLPSDEQPKQLPGPAEMETQAGNVLAPTEHKPEEADTFPVSGFRMNSSVL